MKEAGIPDVDLLENLYANSTVQLHEVGGTGATVTFDTGVAQGSALCCVPYPLEGVEPIRSVWDGPTPDTDSTQDTDVAVAPIRLKC